MPGTSALAVGRASHFCCCDILLYTFFSSGIADCDAQQFGTSVVFVPRPCDPALRKPRDLVGCLSSTFLGRVISSSKALRPAAQEADC